MRGKYFLTPKSQLDSLPNEFLTWETRLIYSSSQGLSANSNRVLGIFKSVDLKEITAPHKIHPI